MKVNPVELEMASVSIEELKSSEDKSYKSLFDKSRMIDSSSKNLLTSIYDFNAVGKDFPRYLLNAEWNECCAQFRSRCIVVSVDDDFVFVPLKLNQNSSMPWWYDISFKPVSVLDRKDSILQTLNVLSEHSVKNVIIGEDSEKAVVDNNYYNTAEDFHSWMDKCKWRSKHGINKLSKIVEFRTEWYDGIESDVKECGEIWNRHRKKIGRSEGSIRGDVKCIQNRMSSLCYTFFCNGKIAGYMIPFVFGRCAAIEASKSISSDIEFCRERFGIDDIEAKLLSANLGRYMQYEMHKDLLQNRKLNAVYYYGDVRSASLREFKKLMFKHKIWYNKYPIKDYIWRLEEGKSENPAVSA